MKRSIRNRHNHQSHGNGSTKGEHVKKGTVPGTKEANPCETDELPQGDSPLFETTEGENPPGAGPSARRRRAQSAFRTVLAVRSVLLAFGHALVFAAVYWLAFLLRFDFKLSGQEAGFAKISLPAVVGLKVLVFFLLGHYRGWWRYVTFADLVALILRQSGIAVAHRRRGLFRFLPHSPLGPDHRLPLDHCPARQLAVELADLPRAFLHGEAHELPQDPAGGHR